MQRLRKPSAQSTLPLSSKDSAQPFIPLHPAFVGKAKVYDLKVKITGQGEAHHVDLSANTCTCKNGSRLAWHNNAQQWLDRPYCSHKLRAISDIVTKAGEPADMLWAYIKAVATRYNRYEVVSAFHKELRRGAVEHAVFWGSILMTFRGLDGVMKYLSNIIYEETREHWLADWLLSHIIAGKRTYNFDTLRYGIALFCAAPKKWELKHRLAFLEGEMRGYSLLIKKYGRDVAQGSDIINGNDRPALTAEMLSGFNKNDLTRIQYGLKGLQKAKSPDLLVHRAMIANKLLERVAVKRPTIIRDKNYKLLLSVLERRGERGIGVGYHELNALSDALSGEPLAAGLMPAETRDSILAAPPPKLRLGISPLIPNYAHDNHTWAGKALIRRFPAEWLPGAKQEHFDLRLCGAYIGVCWRQLAYHQFDAITVDWSAVTWPKWMADTVANLWY